MTSAIETELDDLRQKVSQYEAWFRAIDANSNFDFWFKNAESQYTYVNPHFAKNMGREICHLQNVNPEEIFETDRLERVKKLDREIMDGRYLKRVIPCNASGTMQMHEEHRFAVTDEEGEAIGLGCFAFEVTEKSLAEETLHQAEKIANLCSWRWSAKRNLLVSSSEQLAEFLGVSITEVFEVFPNRAETLVLPEDRHVFKVVEDRMNGVSDEGYEIEYRLRRPDGHVVHVRETAELFTSSEEGNEYLGVMQDITRQKIAVAALRRANDTLELKVQQRTIDIQTAKDKAVAANNAKSQFLARMSHELRTPMNGVLGMAQALEDTPLDEDQKDIVDTIYTSGTALLTILNDILDFSRIDSGLIELNSEPFCLRQSLRDVSSVFTPMAEAKDIGLSVAVHPDVPEQIIGDSERIRQVIMHLVGNAVKFTDAGHVSVDVNAQSSAGKAKLSIEVKDTGIGIDEDKCELIFEEFTQAQQTTTRQYGGTGLGLSLTRKIIEAMPEGLITVESELNKGTIFTIYVTLDVAEAEDFQTPDFQNDVVLLVTPDEARRQQLKTQFTDWKLKTVTSAEARQALKILQHAAAKDINVEAVIVDEDLGPYTGAQFIQALEKSPELSQLKTILLSHHNEDIAAAGMTNTHISTLEPHVLKRVIHDSFNAAPAALPMANLKPATPPLAPKAAPIKAPATPSARTSSSGQTSPEQTGPEQTKKKKSILIVDDNQTNLNVLRLMIGTSNFNIDSALNGKIACDMVREKSYDLIFMDISMTVMGGLEATQLIQKYNRENGRPAVPIVAVSAHIGASDVKIFLDGGMTGYMSKPVTRAKVYDAIHEHLDDTITPVFKRSA